VRGPWIGALAALCAAAGLVGCGGSSGSSADTAAVQQTVTKVLHALGSGDGATVCSLATKDGQAALAKALPHSTCPQVVDLVSAHLSSAQKQGLQSAKVGKVKVDGDHASVPSSAITTSKGTLKGFLQGAPTKLTKQSDGSWKISG
jgi:ketosteroid isomerase-like protein